MSARLRDPAISRLTRNSSPPKIVDMAQQPTLQDRFYPIRTSLPSCISLPDVGDNQFELKPQYLNTLPKFQGFES